MGLVLQEAMGVTSLETSKLTYILFKPHSTDRSHTCFPNRFLRLKALKSSSLPTSCLKVLSQHAYLKLCMQGVRHEELENCSQALGSCSLVSQNIALLLDMLKGTVSCFCDIRDQGTRAFSHTCTLTKDPPPSNI